MPIDLSRLFAHYPELTAEQKASIQYETDEIARRIPESAFADDDELDDWIHKLLEFAQIRCYLLFDVG